MVKNQNIPHRHGLFRTMTLAKPPLGSCFVPLTSDSATTHTALRLCLPLSKLPSSSQEPLIGSLKPCGCIQGAILTALGKKWVLLPTNNPQRKILP